MKKIFAKLTLLLASAPLLLTSCGMSNRAVQVEMNLDYMYMSTNNEEIKNIFPTPLTGNEIQLMFDTRQDFVLYYHREGCPLCEVANPQFNKFLADPKTAYNIYSYDSLSNDNFKMMEKYPDLFNETPKTMFFKNGEHVMDLSYKRYNDYKLFSSAMVSYCVPTRIYTATRKDAIEAFIKNEPNFLLFFKSENNFAETSYNTYHNFVYQVMKDKQTPTLLLSSKKIDSDLKKTILSNYGIVDDGNNTYAIYINGQNFEVFNYASLQGLDSLKARLATLD